MLRIWTVTVWLVLMVAVAVTEVPLTVAVTFDALNVGAAFAGSGVATNSKALATTAIPPTRILLRLKMDNALPSRSGPRCVVIDPCTDVRGTQVQPPVAKATTAANSSRSLGYKARAE